MTSQQNKLPRTVVSLFVFSRALTMRCCVHRCIVSPSLSFSLRPPPALHPPAPRALAQRPALTGLTQLTRITKETKRAAAVRASARGTGARCRGGGEEEARGTSKLSRKQLDEDNNGRDDSRRRTCRPIAIDFIDVDQ
jgi:hypothetical protein